MSKFIMKVADVRPKTDSGFYPVNLQSKDNFGCGFGKLISVWASTNKLPKKGDKFEVSDLVTEKVTFYSDEHDEERTCNRVVSAKIKAVK